MLRKLGFFIAALSLAVPLCAAEKAGTISGYVRDAGGAPQMGAMVEVLGSAMHNLRVFTDANGFYSATGLIPGLYRVRVTSPVFLPALRDRVSLRAGTSVLVNVTLSTLFDAVRLAPWRDNSEDDDWRWVLRSAANRPILRAVSQPSTSQASSGVLRAGDDDRNLKGTLAFLAGGGAQGYGSTSDMSTGFGVEKSIFSSGTIAVRGNLGYAEGLPAGVVRASYRHKLSNGSEPQVALTVRSLPSPFAGMHSASLQALALTTADDFNLGDVLELRFGSEIQTIQFMGRVNAFRPFGSAGLHLSPNTVLSYKYSSSEPDGRLDKGYESAPDDLSEAQPRVSVADNAPALEHAHHHEVSISQRVGGTNLQLAMYSDRVVDPALTGVGEFSSVNGEVLPDLYSGTFTYQGANLNTRGVRVVMQRKLNSEFTATLDYAYGGALELAQSSTLQDARRSMLLRDRHSIAGKLSGTAPGAKTKWIVSYRWANGPTLTSVDAFNDSPGRTDPYLNIYIRQPIPGTGFLPGHMDAMIDIRNLLAEGYVPIMGNDGHTVYLVQDARAVRGGVAFTF